MSVSDLRYHAACPAEGFLRALHLPRSDEYGSAAKLGQAVHGQLAFTFDFDDGDDDV